MTHPGSGRRRIGGLREAGVWCLRLLLLVAVATGIAGRASHAESGDPGVSVAWWRTQFFAWCTGKPVTLSSLTYRKLAAVDRGCARLAQARAETRHTLMEMMLSYYPYWRLSDLDEILLEFSLAVCGEMTARRLGGDPINAVCMLVEPRTVDAKLDLLGLYDTYRQQQIDHRGAEISPAPWTQEAKDRIVRLLKTDPSAIGLRRYLEKIGCKCEAVSGKPERCYLTFGMLGYLDWFNFMAGGDWTITFKQNDRGEATYIDVSLEEYLAP
jgi:hypothetical protein